LPPVARATVAMVVDEQRIATFLRLAMTVIPRHLKYEGTPGRKSRLPRHLW
jgi:hypothetical protein